MTVTDLPEAVQVYRGLHQATKSIWRPDYIQPCREAEQNKHIIDCRNKGCLKNPKYSHLSRSLCYIHCMHTFARYWRPGGKVVSPDIWVQWIVELCCWCTFSFLWVGLYMLPLGTEGYMLYISMFLIFVNHPKPLL